MILATDVFYKIAGGATAAGVLFEDWQQSWPSSVITTEIDSVEEYEPGSFYKRELPCLIKLINALNDVTIQTIIVDGFVNLGDDDGLGMHLYRAYDEKIPVIGVAKTPFHQTPIECQVLRGSSNKPLYVTSVGIDLEVAKNSIKNMHGPHRNPTLLKMVDSYCRRRYP